MNSDFLKDLNQEQKRAVLQTEGPIIILAGAGSGKTRVLTYKVIYLIKEKNIDPFNILMVTFTNKAANEMKERVQKNGTKPNHCHLPFSLRKNIENRRKTHKPYFSIRYLRYSGPD